MCVDLLQITYLFIFFLNILYEMYFKILLYRNLHQPFFLRIITTISYLSLFFAFHCCVFIPSCFIYNFKIIHCHDFAGFLLH